MDNRAEVREFLTSRRAKISPEQAGLPAGSRRRVPGLRRSEVAALADVSVEYYAKLERGNLAGASPAVLEAVARALQLDDAERVHLMNLAQAADGSDALTRPRRRTARAWTAHRSLQWVLDAVTAGPAFVRNGRMDILAANQLALAFYDDVYATAGNQANLARFRFLDPASRRFYPDWAHARRPQRILPGHPGSSAAGSRLPRMRQRPCGGRPPSAPHAAPNLAGASRSAIRTAVADLILDHTAIEDVPVPDLPVTLDMPGKVADFLHTAELEPAEQAALEEGDRAARPGLHPACHRRPCRALRAPRPLPAP